MKMRLTGHVQRVGAKKSAHKIVVGKPEEKRNLDLNGRILLK
jgi:hypothetical protein